MWGDRKVLVLESSLEWLAQGKGLPPAGALYPWSVKGAARCSPQQSRCSPPSGLAPAILYC